jgi:ankyrin repeat protein
MCLLEAGANLDATDSRGYTLLQRTSNLKIIEALLPKIDVNASISASGQRLLTRALVAKDVDFSLKLLDQGADTTLLDSSGNSVLHLAVKIPGIEKMPNRKLLEKLIERGADPNIRNSDGKTALHLVVNSFYFDEARFAAFLDAMNPDLEIRDEKGRTIAFAFLDEWDSQRESYALSFLAILFERGARFDVTDQKGRTLLHVAIRLCVTDGALIKFLVEKGVDPHQPDFEGNTIWHEGARWFPGRAVGQQVFTDLQDLGVSCNQRNSRGVLPFHVLCRFKKAMSESPTRQEYPCAFDLLRESNPDVINSTDNDGVSPLHITSTCSTNVTKRLLELGADITRTTHEKLTVFHLAARSRQVDVIWLLADWFKTNRADQKLDELLSARDAMGRTALYYACASGSNEVVQILLDSGAAANTETFIGSTWNGVADFEEEQKNWVLVSSGSSVHHDNPFYKPDAAGVLIADNLRPKPPGIQSNSYPAKQIDKVVSILIARGLASDITLVDEAIASASQKKNEHTVKCLEDARASLIARLETQNSIGTEDVDSFGLLQNIIPGLLEEMSLEERDASIHQKLLDVIDEGDVETLRRILSTGQVNANLRKLGKEVPSWTSADKRSMRPAKHDPNTNSELYVLEYLVTCDSRRQNDYHVAIGKRMFNLLLEHGADLNSRYECKTLVHRILEKRGFHGRVFTGENPYLDLMLKHPSLNIEATDGTGATLFLRACALVDVPVAEVLLGKGALVTTRDNQQKNALHHLCSHFYFMTERVYGDIGCSDMAKQREFLIRLIQLAPDLLLQVDKHGRTPLLCALGQAGRGRDLGEGIDALLDNGADVTAPNPESGETPLHLLFGGRWQIDAKGGDDVAAVCGRRQVLLHKFLAHGADINAKDRAGETPAFRFMRKGIVKVKIPQSEVDSSLRGEAYFAADNMIDKRKGEAAVRLQGIVMDLFSQVGVDWTHLSTRGQSLLHLAAGRGDDVRYQKGRGLGRLRYLMGKGLDVLAEDDQHRSALDFAAASGAENILEYVRKEHGYSSRNV